MKKLNLDQIENIAGGKCAPGPGESGDNSPITCTGLCLAGYLSFINSDGNSSLEIIFC